MTLDKWRDLVARIKDDFETEDEGRYAIDEHGGIEVEYIEFYAPLGLVRLELSAKPRVTGRKTSYSNRIGSEVDVEYTYDYDDLVYQMDAYLFDEGSEDWQLLENANIFA